MRVSGWIATGRGVAATLLAVLCVGCGAAPIDPAVKQQFKAISDMYCDYAFAHANAGPGDEQVFRKHAKTMNQRTALAMGVDINKLDELFISPRDQKPITVRYGQSVSNLGDKAPLIAHESVGVRGKRLAVYANGRVEELDESKLQP